MSADAAAVRATRAGGSGPGQRSFPGRRPAIGRWLAGLTVALVVVALTRSLLVQSFVVPTGSMSPAVQAGDRVFVSRLSYRVGDVGRGDVVVFNGAGVFDSPTPPSRSPLAQAGRGIAAVFGVPIGSRDYVKRVIGLPGEHVVCCDSGGRITVDGKLLVEPYLADGVRASETPFDVVVPPGRLWVMGDNRADSADSRAHLGAPGGGTVPVDNVVGRVVGIFWPMAHAGGVGRDR